MNNFLKKVLLAFLLLFCIQFNAQSDSTSVNNQKYCIPALEGVPIGKGASIEYESMPSYNIKTIDKTGNFGDSNTKIRSSSRIEAKLRIPILIKPYLNIIGGFKYTFEEYHFKNLTEDSNPFNKNFEDRTLKSINTNLTIIKPTKSNKYWLFRLNAALNGDYNRETLSKSNFLKFSIAPALGWKVNNHFSYALGVSYNYRFGSPLVVPIIALNAKFNKWDLASVLPLFVKVRYIKSENLHWLNKIEIEGNSYRLTNFGEELSQYKNIHLHRSEVQLSTSIEKRLIGWLWAALEVGYRDNLTFNVTNSNTSKKNILFENKLSNGFLFNFSLFLSPSEYGINRVF